MDSRLLSYLKRPHVRWAVTLIAWTLPALLFASQQYVSFRSAGRPIPWITAYRDQLVYCELWALLTPLILFLGRRFPMERPHVAGRILFHFLVSLIVSLAQRLAYSLYAFYFPILPLRRFSVDDLFLNLFNLFDYGILIYWVILAIGHAIAYYNKFREGELRSSQLEMRLAQAQLQALKMQLHPHFLFNTLHSISALMNRDMKTADKMIARLGDFLRLTLENSGAQEVPLQKELEFLRCYLEIEQIRFQDRLSVRMEIDPEAADASVPNLILQPIVENAIRHGIAPQIDPGRIDISAERRNGILRIQVRDNGPGLMTEETEKRSRIGVGLSNTKSRLQQLYGDRHRFDLSNGPEGGLVVTLEIPVVAPQPAGSAEVNDGGA